MSSGNADGGPNQTIEADAVLTDIISNGPLSIFCNLGRMIFEALLFEVSDLTESIEKAWKLLERTLDSPHLPLVNASGEMWVEFDRLRDKVRHTVDAEERSIQNAEKLRALLDMIERVNRIHPPVDARTEMEGNGDNQTRAGSSPNQDARLLGGAPIPGSSKEVEMSRLETEDPRHLSPNLSTIPQAETDRLTSHQVMVSETPTPSIPTTQSSPGAEIRSPLAYPRNGPQIHPPASGIPTSVTPGTSGPRRSASLGPANLQAQSHRSMDSGPLETPDSKARDSKCLFTCFRRR